MADDTSTGRCPEDEPYRIIHSAGSIETIAFNDYEVTTHLDADRIDVHVRNGDGRLIWRDRQAATASGIEKIASSLNAHNIAAPKGLDLQQIMSLTTYRLIDTASAGAGFVNIFHIQEKAKGNMYLVWPLVILGATSILLGPTGSAKSATAAAVALVAATGQQIGPYRLEGDRVNVGIADGEDTQENVLDVIEAIAKVEGIDLAKLEAEGRIRYLKVDREIIGQAESLRRMVEEHEIGLMIVDSVDTARGPDAVNQSGVFFDTLRYIGCSFLAVDHVPAKDIDRQMKEWSSYGGVRIENRVRQTYVIKVDEDKNGEDKAHVTLRLNKINRGKTGSMMQHVIEYDQNENGSYESIRFGETSVVVGKTPTQPDRVLIAIHRLTEQGVEIDNTSIGEAVGLNGTQVSNAMKRLKERRLVTEAKPRMLMPDGVKYLRAEWPGGLPELAAGDA